MLDIWVGERMSEEINVEEVIRTIKFSEITQKGYKVMSNDEFDGIVNGVLKLQQENQQLKEQLENASKNYTKYIQERDNVLDEIREYINNENYKDENICIVDGIEILQILDKVKE